MNEEYENAKRMLTFLHDHAPVRYWLICAVIESSVGAQESNISGMSKGQYKRIIREGRQLQSSDTAPYVISLIDGAILYIRSHMDEWRA